MKWITFSIVLALLQGCAGVPSASERAAAPVVRAIAWTRGVDAEPFRDQHGVCHTFAHDRESAFRTLGAQVQACFDGRLPVVAVTAPAAGAVRMTWRKVPASHIDELFSQSADASFLNAAGRRRAAVFSVNGFYEYNGDTCYVTVADRDGYAATLGHEFKHCVDGEFHDERGAWRARRSG